MLRYRQASSLNAGDIILVEDDKVAITKVELVADNRSTLVDGVCDGLGKIFLLIPDDTEFELVADRDEVS